jgi:dephospho-CoA kinase
MFLIGVTGNIATGKSTVTGLLESWGAAVIDSDRLVHELYRPGTEVTAQIEAQFGANVLGADGGVDRGILSREVFGHPEKLRRLETIVWPAVGKLRDLRMEQCAAPVVVVSAVKLMESGYDRHCDTVWLVVAKPSVQEQRLGLLRSLSEEEIARRLSSQPDTVEKTARCQAVIENNGTLEQLKVQVLHAWRSTVPEATRNLLENVR